MMLADTQPQPSDADRGLVRRLLFEALTRKLGEAGAPTAGVDETTPLIDLGVIDSQGLLDIILEAEDGCGLTFDPLLIDFESGVTLERIAAAFTEQT
jgi:hypothetical protein